MAEPEQVESSISDTAGKIFSIVVRRRWWIIPPTCLLAIASALVLPKIPSVYTSDATLTVAQPKVAAVYVTPLANGNAADMIRALTREIISRPRLLQIVDELGLYPGSARTDRLLDKVRESIVVEPLDSRGLDYSSFRLSFSADNPHLAQTVTSRLASLFIEENAKAQGERADNTNSFLSSQVAEVKRKLDSIDAQLNITQTNNLGQLPEEQAQNQAAIMGLRGQLQTALDNLTRARLQRDSLMSILNDQMARATAERSALLGKFTEAYPAVLAKDREIARAKALLDRLNGGKGSSEAAAGISEDPMLSQLRAQVETNSAEIANLLNSQKRLEEEIAQYQQRLRLTPNVGSQVAILMRDRDRYSKEYSDLLKSQNDSKLTVAIVRNDQGQHFSLIDPPSLPTSPSSPNGPKILIVALGLGFVVGCVLALLVELRRPTFHTEKEIALAYPAPVVIAVPVMRTTGERRARQARIAVESILALALIVLVAFLDLQALGVLLS